MNFHEDWRLRARCKDADSDLFFPVGEGSAARYQAWQAKQICRRCPVLADCAQWVGGQPQEFGVFAGMTPAERRGKAELDPVRYCLRCNEQFAWKPEHPHARMCHGCDRRRTGDNLKHGNAAKTHCPRDHEYTPENTLYSKAGARRCRACKLADNERRYLLRKAVAV